MTSKKLMHTLEGHAMPIRSLCFSPDSKKLITGEHFSMINNESNKSNSRV